MSLCNAEIMNKNNKQKTIIILGPTSSGKSEVAIRIAKQFNGEVISADSRQVYKDMDLGTGKVEGRWYATSRGKIFYSDGIPHHLIDFRSPRGEYNVSHFQKDCLRLIREISKLDKVPIICGGTGFWISAIVDGLVLPKVKPDPVLRKHLDKSSTDKLFETLKKLDPLRANTIDRKNKIRLIRAIEICKAVGKVPKPKQNSKIENNQFLQIGIDWPQDLLDQKIRVRLNYRLRSGMVKEVIMLKNKYGLGWKKIQSFGLGYFWIPEFLLGGIDEAQLKQNVFCAERNYAKRQRTWFKRNKEIFWENDYRKIKKKVSKFLTG